MPSPFTPQMMAGIANPIHMTRFRKNALSRFPGGASSAMRRGTCTTGKSSRSRTAH